jgi:hypothetical protein
VSRLARPAFPGGQAAPGLEGQEIEPAQSAELFNVAGVEAETALELHGGLLFNGGQF